MTDDMTRIIRKLNRSGQTHTMFEAFKRMHGRYPESQWTLEQTAKDWPELEFVSARERG
jgi:hypothetical protein